MTIKDLILDAIAKAFVTVKNEIQPQIDDLNTNLRNHSYASGSYKNTTSGWEYSGIYYDFPAGSYAVWIGIGYSSQRPDGVALHTESTGSGYFQAQYVDTTNGIGRRSPLMFIVGGYRYYLMVRRSAAAGSANEYSINGFKLP